jgi:hypothetical protein
VTPLFCCHYLLQTSLFCFMFTHNGKLSPRHDPRIGDYLTQAGLN